MKKIGTKTYPNGTKYKGEIDKEGHPHGKGTMIFPKQFTYIHKGKKYISNVLISSWGKKKYVGQFFHGLMHGKGTATYRNGSIYEGEFRTEGILNVREFNWSKLELPPSVSVSIFILSSNCSFSNLMILNDSVFSL